MRYDVIIFDGNNTAHKAYHVNRNLYVKINGEEIFTGMIYGFLNMMLNIYEEFGNINTRIMVVWDSIDSAVSNQSIDANYKANRKPQTEEELADKIRFTELINNTMGILSTLNILQMWKPKYEADDIIATLTYKLSSKNKNVLIVTEDKDYRQLISDKVNLYGITQRILWDISTFKDKTGLFKPKHFCDYLAICGDSIDNFGGVPGFGDSKARQLLTSKEFVIHDSVSEYIIENPESILKAKFWSDKVKQSFYDNISELEKCYKLAKLKTDIQRVRLCSERYFQTIETFCDILELYKMKSLLRFDKLDAFSEILNATRYWNNHFPFY